MNEELEIGELSQVYLIAVAGLFLGHKKLSYKHLIAIQIHRHLTYCSVVKAADLSL